MEMVLSKTSTSLQPNILATSHETDEKRASSSMDEVSCQWLNAILELLQQGAVNVHSIQLLYVAL